MQYTIKLNNSILGWILVPVSDNAKEILAMLYGVKDYDAGKRSEFGFKKGEPLAKALAHVKDVCRQMGVKVSVCGRKAGPTLRLWYTPPVVVTPEDIRIDLKWSLWSRDRSTWDEYTPGTWDRIERAFKGTGPAVRILTGPRKEIRFGAVTVARGEAYGVFTCEWDECESLADTLGTECDEAFRETIPHSVEAMAPGNDWDFTVKARSFGKLMERIDAEESRLLEHDRREWDFIKSCFDKVSDTRNGRE